MALMIGETSGKIIGKIPKFVLHKRSLFGQVRGGAAAPSPPVNPGLGTLVRLTVRLHN